MRNQVKLIACMCVSVLLVAAAAPEAAHAGTMTIKNEECKSKGGLFSKKKNRVKVKISADPGCTSKTVTVPKGGSVVVELKETTNKKKGLFGQPYTTDEHTCKYKHKAVGAPVAYYDVWGDQDTSVTCKKDWAGFCDCTKD